MLFRAVEVERFGVIVDYRDLKNHWPGTMTRFGLSSEEFRINETAAHSPSYAEERGAVLADGRLVAELRGILSNEIKFFETWVQPR